MPNIEEQNGILLNYIITYTSNLDGPAHTMMTLDTNILLTDLEEFTQYFIVVNASTSAGIGPGAETTGRTLPDGMYSMCNQTLS